ncbi:LysR family transcriptional regulator [Pusillimonas noertemannii]|uniref:LysR family transcriptional regulator n=1 Tax=Pusillimonas noertemannii TaxID=305977 RepID=A0A2U1CPY9_9BURK|nr:LysR family transcriptional regulator [Pusillimonas noertemannii]NYT67276.1 LysR family transcriptional regulator [Pusillimonas noertemannii]PVY67949.1 LysR family transcriptional regulator [Pusillimonas noertemannii]TFL12531.1 LysR family transcriptional regulator [Pusillimonas noertemannii]
MDLKDIDLNLLVVFNRLLMERSVSAAADKLGLTQPAVSNALKRLRVLLNDELFLRTTRGMEPTPYALQLAEPIAYALSTIQSTLSHQTVFDPATSDRRFTLAMTDLGEIELLPPLMDRLEELAPGVTVSTVRNADRLRDDMEAGHVDLAIGLLPGLKTNFFQQRLFMQRYVCLFRRGHALDKRRVTRREFYEADHVVVVSAGTGHAKMDEIIESAEETRRVRLLVPHFVAIGHILASTEMIATVPERYARRCAEPFGLRYVDHPVELPQIGINLFWHAKFHKEPGNQWLRQLIFELFSTSLNVPERGA